MKVSNRPKLQSNLDFVDTTTNVLIRNKQCYENVWMMLHCTYYELYNDYIMAHPDNKVSLGTFRTLKPFYMRTETEKDVEMCCCKLHLHARWTIQAIITCATELHMELPFSNYSTFFEFLTKDCTKDPESTTYIPWPCTPNKNNVCTEIDHIWHNFSTPLLEASSPDILVPLTTFETVEYTKKNGDVGSKLKAVKRKCTMEKIVNFFSGILTTIINHRNHLKHYRSVIHAFKDNFDALQIDIDFAENLKLPLKSMPQSLYWSQEACSVHSGIIILHNEKHYHPYISDDKKHDQVFVRVVLEQMIATVETLPELCVIESDNCSSQYKSAHHFEDLQNLSDMMSTTLIRVFSVAGHGKGEVDHVGGLAKCAVRRYVGTGKDVLNAGDCVTFLDGKFGCKTNPTFHIKEINVDELNERRAETRQKKYPTVSGSDSFQVMVFTPHSRTFKAASYLCMCEECKQEYGSCDLFSSYDLKTFELKKIFLRSDVLPAPTSSDDNHEEIFPSDFLLPDTYCAVAPDLESNPTNDSVWFIKVKDTFTAKVSMTDDYDHTIPVGSDYIEGQFMEKIDSNTKGYIYKLTKKKTFFYKETVVLPYVQFSSTKKGLLLAMAEFVDVLNLVENLHL